MFVEQPILRISWNHMTQLDIGLQDLLSLLKSTEKDEPQLHFVSATGFVTWNELLIRLSLNSIDDPFM